MHTLQEIFDISTKGLIQQGGASYDERIDMCLYRFGDKKCAAGWLIPDDEYSLDMEGIGADNLVYFTSHLDPIQLSLLVELQTAHDNLLYYGHDKKWRVELLRIAKVFNLKTDVLDEVLTD